MKEKEFNLEKEYGKLKSKFSLPSYKDLNNEFELSVLSEGDFLLRSMRRKMCEKIEDFCNILEGFIHPHSASLANFYELKFVDDDEKEKISRIFKKFMILRRKNLRFDLEPKEKDEAKFINEIYKEWLVTKKELLNLVNIIEDGWTKEEETKTNEGYFG